MNCQIFLIMVIFTFSIFFVNTDNFVNAIEYTDDSDYLPSWAIPLDDDLAIDECFEIIENSLPDSEWCADWLNYLLLKELGFLNESPDEELVSLLPTKEDFPAADFGEFIDPTFVHRINPDTFQHIESSLAQEMYIEIEDGEDLSLKTMVGIIKFSSINSTQIVFDNYYNYDSGAGEQTYEKEIIFDSICAKSKIKEDYSHFQNYSSFKVDYFCTNENIGITLKHTTLGDFGERNLKLILESQAEKITSKVLEKINQNLANSEKSSQSKIPDWVRNNAKWWAQGAIGDSDFVSGIQYLIKAEIMLIPETEQTTFAEGTEEIPNWIKNNADWWAQGLISDDDFVKGIQYLVEQGIMVV